MKRHSRRVALECTLGMEFVNITGAARRQEPIVAAVFWVWRHAWCMVTNDGAVAGSRWGRGWTGARHRA